MSILFNGNCYYQYNASTFPLTQSAKTVCMWLNLSDSTTLQTMINAVDLTLGIGFQFGVKSSTLAVWGYGGTNYITCTTPALNTWAFLVYTYDGTTHTLYLNNVAVATSTTASQTGQPTICQLGGNQWGEYPRSMLMEDVRVYNRVLSANEQTTIFNSMGMDMIVYGMIAWFQMNELLAGLTLDGTAGSIKEQSGIAGTLVGSTPYPIAQNSVKLQRRH